MLGVASSAAGSAAGASAAGASAAMLPSSPSSVMKAKIQQAQDARRQRLRTRLEEMAATGNPVHLAAPAFRRSDAGGPLPVPLLLCC